jgi:hypothetical protein
MPKSFALKRPAFVGRSVRVVKAEADFYEKTRLQTYHGSTHV